MSEILRLRVTGTPWAGWETAIKRALLDVDGVEGVTASSQANLVGILFDAVRITPGQIEEKIAALGYTVAGRVG